MPPPMGEPSSVIEYISRQMNTFEPTGCSNPLDDDTCENSPRRRPHPFSSFSITGNTTRRRRGLSRRVRKRRAQRPATAKRNASAAINAIITSLGRRCMVTTWINVGENTDQPDRKHTGIMELSIGDDPWCLRKSAVTIPGTPVDHWFHTRRGFAIMRAWTAGSATTFARDSTCR